MDSNFERNCLRVGKKRQAKAHHRSSRGRSSRSLFSAASRTVHLFIIRKCTTVYKILLRLTLLGTTTIIKPTPRALVLKGRLNAPDTGAQTTIAAA